MQMNEKRAQRYSIVEAALCDVFGIEPNGIKPFQARIRHLRSIGVPNLPRSGSGKWIEYSFDQILEVAFALCLQRYGVTPRIAAEMGPAIAKTVGWMGAGSHHENDVYIILEPSKSSSLSCEFVPGLDLLKRKIDARCEDDALLIMNASSLVRKIEQALSKERN
jgi:hypothetical protein